MLAECAARLPDGPAFLAALPGPFRRALRRHPRRGQLGPWRELSPVPWSPLGSFHGPDQDPGGHLDYHTGTIYPQDAASQLPVELLAIQPGEVVIDLCAAPGSKSTQIGLALQDDGLLICADRSQPRRRVLSENLARQGVACALVTPMTPEALAERHPRCADALLLDAPCSGHEARSARQVARMAEQQLALLQTASQLVRPGGRLVYSTCTPYPAENEELIARFLATHPAWTIRPRVRPGCDPDLDGRGALRLWPHRQGTEPFYACLLVQEGFEPATGIPGRAPQLDRTLARYLPDSPLCCYRRAEAVVMATAQVAACALPADTRGLLVTLRERLLPWAAQALIERGAAHQVVERAQALALWAGGACALPLGSLVKTMCGSPLGVIDAQGRLDQPSRQFRADLQ